MKKLFVLLFTIVSSTGFAQLVEQSIAKHQLDLDPLSYSERTPGEAVQRTPLFEMFTSSTCPPCYQGNIDLHSAFGESDGNWTCVKYQMYWPGNGDPYFTDEGYSRSRLFDISAVPALLVDGNTVPISTLDGNVVEDLQVIPSYINLEATFMQDEKNFNIQVDATPTQVFFTPFINLYVAIVENRTTQNAKTNGETKFEYVMKKMLPTTSGTSVKPLKTGVTQSFELSYKFQGEYRLPNDANDPINHEIEHSIEDFNDLSVVVWVQNKITGEVLQSTWATTTSATNKISETGNGIISLFPNPAREMVYIHYLIKKPANAILAIYNLAGNQIESYDPGIKKYGNYTESIDVSTLDPGAYLIQLQLGEEVYSKKLLKVE